MRRYMGTYNKIRRTEIQHDQMSNNRIVMDKLTVHTWYNFLSVLPTDIPSLVKKGGGG